MRFVDVILKNLIRRKTRSFLTAGGLAVAVATTTALLSIAWSFASSAFDVYGSRAVDLVVVRAGVAERITSSLGRAQGQRLAALAEIAEVDGSLTEMVSFGRTLVGIPLRGLDPAGFGSRQFIIDGGRGLRPDDR